ncbi:MAG: CopG family transcriptional regulator [Desulfococcaceae bacterium]|nr:CopG family transcriptional regulator [Desulfococcaceae bacterium]
MPSVKTAVSIEKNLFDQANTLAMKMKIPRSRLFSLAVEDFIRRNEDKVLLERINTAHDDPPDAEEEKTGRFMRSKHKKAVKGQW